MVDFDAIVVGAGPNGLAAALRVAEAGWSVCLVEATEETAAWIDKVHLGDGRVWTELDRAWGDALRPFLHAQMVRWPVAEVAELAWRLGVRGAVGFARMVLGGADQLARRFESEQAGAFLVAPAMHADLPP